MTKLKELTSMTSYLKHTINNAPSSHNTVLGFYRHLINSIVIYNQQNTNLIKEMDNRIKMLENAQNK